jgi:hypothetical protein
MRLVLNHVLVTESVQVVNVVELFNELLKVDHESLHVASIGVKDTRMDSRCRILSSFLVGSDSASLDRSSLEEVETLFNHIEFHQPTMTLFWIRNGIQFNTVKTVPVETKSTTSGMEKTVSKCEWNGEDGE